MGRNNILLYLVQNALELAVFESATSFVGLCNPKKTLLKNPNTKWSTTLCMAYTSTVHLKLLLKQGSFQQNGFKKVYYVLVPLFLLGHFMF